MDYANKRYIVSLLSHCYFNEHSCTSQTIFKKRKGGGDKQVANRHFPRVHCDYNI